MLVDSHAHLAYFNKEEREQIIERAFFGGVNVINNISTEVSKIEELIAITSPHKNIYNTVGLHPCNVEDEPQVTAKQLIEIAQKHKSIIGIGETGLDYYHSTQHKALQIEKFKEHITAAAQLKMPIIVHTRSADEDTLKILTEAKNAHGGNLKVLIHCFTGGVDFCRQLLEIGCYISFSGIVTFKNAKEVQEAMKAVPMERMLIETDSPYLAPVPNRGKKNEPLFVKHVARHIAGVRGIAFGEVCNVTSKNFCKLFNVKYNEDI